MTMPGPITWKTTTQQLAPALRPDGTYGPMWQIGYQTSTGVAGYVFLTPDDARDPAKVTAAIQLEVDGVIARHQLSG